MVGEKNADYFMEHVEEFDALSEDDKTKLLTHGFIQGDTEAATAEAEQAAEEQVAAPDAATEEKPEEQQEAVAAAEEAPKAVEEEPKVLTADGKHTIPFSELKAARERADHLERLVADQQALLDSLAAAKEQDAGTGDTKAQDDVMASLKENFPELAEVLAPVMQSLIDTGVNQRVSALEAKFNSVIEPMQKDAETQAVEGHYKAIADAHGDYQQLLDSGEIDRWIEKQPSFLQDSYKQVLEKGTAPKVIELFDAYRASNPAKTEPSTVDLSAEARKVVDKAKSSPPLSLSDVPAGGAAHHDEAEAMMEMSGLNLMDKFTGKSPAQIEALMSKII